MADIQQPEMEKTERAKKSMVASRDIQHKTDCMKQQSKKSLNGWLLTLPDILSGQDVQQLSHVSWPFSQLHRELTDPIVQHQGSVHTLPHQLQLHVSAAHHNSDPTAQTHTHAHTHTHTHTKGVLFHLQPNGLALLTSLHCQNVGISSITSQPSQLGLYLK